MKNIYQTHQAFFFSNNESIAPTPPNITSLLNAFGRFGLIPTVGNEFNPIIGEKKQFIIMINSDESMRLEMPTGCFALTKLGGNQEDFYDLVMKVFTALETIYPNQKAHRISLLNSSFFQGTPEEYAALYQKLFTNRKASPFEWDNRIVEKRELNKSKEIINSISSIRRSELRLPNINNGNPSDLISFNIESNTDGNNLSQRFLINSALSIWEELFENNQQLTQSLQRYEK